MSLNLPLAREDALQVKSLVKRSQKAREEQISIFGDEPGPSRRSIDSFGAVSSQSCRPWITSDDTSQLVNMVENIDVCRHIVSSLSPFHSCVVTFALKSICRYFGEDIDREDPTILKKYCDKMCDVRTFFFHHDLWLKVLLTRSASIQTRWSERNRSWHPRSTSCLRLTNCRAEHAPERTKKNSRLSIYQMTIIGLMELLRIQTSPRCVEACSFLRKFWPTKSRERLWRGFGSLWKSATRAQMAWHPLQVY